MLGNEMPSLFYVTQCTEIHKINILRRVKSPAELLLKLKYDFHTLKG